MVRRLLWNERTISEFTVASVAAIPSSPVNAHPAPSSGAPDEDFDSVLASVAPSHAASGEATPSHHPASSAAPAAKPDPVKAPKDARRAGRGHAAPAKSGKVSQDDPATSKAAPVVKQANAPASPAGAAAPLTAPVAAVFPGLIRGDVKEGAGDEDNEVKVAPAGNAGTPVSGTANIAAAAPLQMAVETPVVPAGRDPAAGTAQKPVAQVAGTALPSRVLDEIIAAAKPRAEATANAAPAPAATAQGSIANIAAMIQAARGTITVAAPSKRDTAGDTATDDRTANAAVAGRSAPGPADAPPQKVDPVRNAGDALHESSSQSLPDAVPDKIAAPQSAPQVQSGSAPAQTAAIIAPVAADASVPAARAPASRPAIDLPDANLQPNIGALAAAIAAKSVTGCRTFDIRLDPPELGRVDVHLTVDNDGKVQAVMLADHPHTLELLQRGSHDLERALKDAGLSLSNNSLNFSLKGEGRQGDGGGASMARARSLTSAVVARAEAANASEISFGSASGRLDIRV